MAGASAVANAAVELCKGISGLDKVVLREASGWSAEVRFLLPPSLECFFDFLCFFD